MAKRQKYSNGGGAKQVKDVFKLESITGSNSSPITSKVAIKPAKNVDIVTTQKDGRNVKTDLNFDLPIGSGSLSRSKGGGTSGKFTRDTSNFLGKNSNLTGSFDRPPGGGKGTYYGIKYTKFF